MDFILFILVTGVLMVRPAEIIPGLEGVPVYEFAILSCLVVALPAVLIQLTPASLARRPITVCVIALLPAITLSHLSHGETERAVETSIEFAKVLVYYLLLVGVVNTPTRLRQYLLWLGVFTLVLTAVALLRYYGVYQVEVQQAPVEVRDPRKAKSADHSVTTIEVNKNGERVEYKRLGTAFYDPNDLCLVLVMGMGICAYAFSERCGGAARWLWPVAALLFGFALVLTHSRGGFLALLIGVAALFYSRLGPTKAIIAGLAVLPLLFLAFGGRQTNFELGQGTGQTRIQLWSDGLDHFLRSPLFGIGVGRYDEEIGHVAHNSFIHAYTETGLLGGTLFVGVCYLALVSLLRLRRQQCLVSNRGLSRTLPFLTAMAVAYCGGMLSLSRCYIVPTYLLLGLVTVYLRLAGRYAPLSVPRLDGRLLGRMAAVSVLCLLVIFTFVRLAVRWV